MPIIKDTNASDTAVTIRRFPNGSDIAGLTGVQSLNYINLNRAHFGQNQNEWLWVHQNGGSVVIRCELADDATGDFYGDFSTLHISISNKTITWWSGTYAIGTKTWQKGVHMYGFTPDPSDSTKFLAWYDNERFGTARSITETGNYVYIGFCCGHSTDTSGVGSDGEWAIRVWDVTAYFGSVWHHIYPIVENPTTTAVAKMMETRIRGDNNTIVFYTATTPVSSSSYSAGPTEAWGVSIHDLKNAFNVGYNDAMAIVCADNGSPASYADPSDKVTDSSNQVHNFAFRLASGDGTTIADPKIGLNNGLTLNARSGTYTLGAYELGELIFGRKPKWPLWADGLRVGKYVKNFAASGQTANLKFVYNFMKTHKGTIHTGKLSDGSYSDIGDYNPNNEYVTELLRRFDGVDTAASKIHEPKFNVDGSVSIEFHNRVACFCRNDEKLIGLGQQSAVDNYAIFKYNTGTELIGYAYVGNLIPWDLTATELAQEGCNWAVKGVAIQVYSAQQIAAKTWTFVDLKEYASSDAMMCASNQQDKQRFMDGILFTEGVFNPDRMNELYYLFNAISGSWPKTLPMKAKLSLLTAWKNTAVSAGNTISTERVMPEKSISVSGTNNPKVSSSSSTTPDRLVVGENGGICNVNDNDYNINILATANYGTSLGIEWKAVNLSTSQNNYGMCLAFEFALERNNALLDIGSTYLLFAFAEVTEIGSDGNFNGKYFGFTKPFTTKWSEHSWINPSPYSSPWWGDRNIASPSNITEEQSYNKWRACFFRWQELMCDSNQSAAPSGYITSHVRMFPNWASGGHGEKAPCAWDIHHLNKYWDNLSNTNGYNTGSPFVTFGNYRLFFVDTPRIMPYNVSSGQVLIVDCWFSLWGSTSTPQGTTWAQIKSANSLPAMKIVLRKKSCQEPYHSSTPTIDGTLIPRSSGATYTFAFNADSGSDQTDDNVTHYSAKRTTRTQYQGFTVLPSGLGGDMMDGFYNLQIKIDSGSYEAGAMYTIQFLPNS